jgi:UDP-glucose 4-epimerase
MTLLVTGSAGHLGEALVRTLRERGQAVRGADLRPTPFTDHVGSITDRAFVARCLEDVRAVIHTATLHKPHLATHSVEEFLHINVAGTLVLLEEASAAGVEGFIFTSSTSAFGTALMPAPAEPAVWVTEELVPVPKNIYGTTKVMAENLCERFHRQERLPVVVLRTARFFPEADDDAAVRYHYPLANVQANELLFRRADLEDVVSAHLLALGRAANIGFARYVISATTPFTSQDLPALRRNAADVVRRLFPKCESLYADRGWKLFPAIDRVNVNERARAELGWRPKHDFAHVLASLSAGQDFRSALARAVGSKGYHDRTFGEAPYPVQTSGRTT